MSTIYVITSGEYSCYCIRGVATDPERARAMKRKVEAATRDEVYIEEFEDGKLEEAIECLTPKDYWRVEIKTGGHEPYVTRYTVGTPETIRVAASEGKGPWTTNQNGYPVREVFIRYIVKGIDANDEEHALKIAYDKLAEYNAQQEGI